MSVEYLSLSSADSFSRRTSSEALLGFSFKSFHLTPSSLVISVALASSPKSLRTTSLFSTQKYKYADLARFGTFASFTLFFLFKSDFSGDCTAEFIHDSSAFFILWLFKNSTTNLLRFFCVVFILYFE